MRRLFLTAVLLIAATPAAAAARAPVTHPYDHAWLYASNLAQAGAEWMFPHAHDPFGQVVRDRGCDLQQDGSYDCSLDLAIYSSGHWTGRQPPASVEHWACDGATYITVRRTRRGTITTSALENPCHPTRAPDQQQAKLRFVATVHHRKPQVGRVRAVHCLFDVDDAGTPLFGCTAATGRSAVRGQVDVFGAVSFGLPYPASPAAPEAVPSTEVPG